MDKKRIIVQTIFITILVLIIPVISKVLTGAITIYKLDFSLIPEGYLKSCVSINAYKDIFDFSNPFNCMGLAIIGGMIFITFLNNLLSFKDDETYEMLDEYGSHGTSRWQTKKEIKENYYKDKVGWFLGSTDENKTYDINMDAAYHPVNGGLNMQITVVGPPGSNKTTGFVLNNIFHISNVYKDNKKEKADLIITDPKSELYSLTASHLKKCGYDVKVLDFIHLKFGGSLNPLKFINDDKSLMEIAQGYIDSIEAANGGKATGEAAFWNNQEAQVLAALMGFVKQVLPKEDQNFYSLSQILTSKDVNDSDRAKELFNRHNIKGAALQFWNNFLMLSESERTRAIILGGLAEKLKLFAIQGIVDVTSSTTIDISKIGAKKEKPMALFILMPDGDRTFTPVINVIVSTLFKQLYKTAYKTKNRLEYPVYFILEEMANIGKISGIQEMLGTMRGRRIYPMMIWQSLSQMKSRYGNEAFEDIMSMCDTHVYLGINDMFTAKYCSDSVGYTTIKIQGTTKEAKGVFAIDTKSESKNFHQRKLIIEDECMRLARDKMILRQIAHEPFILNKVQYKYWEKELCTYTEVFDSKQVKSYPKKHVNIITNENKEEENLQYNKSNSLDEVQIDEEYLKEFNDYEDDNYEIEL